ncbi:MAG TPA: PIG-L family deacetylase [Acidimicrobiales bacterium]|nr:PIG-L family deacetylase [Acidimicrobiales bacterium]
MPYTVVSFHAHPDDEALLTAGTLARAAAEGHRVVLVAATAGGVGLASSEVADGADLAGLRWDELRRAAAAIGCHEVHLLGYEDSGMDGCAGSDERAFSRAPVDEAAGRLAGLLEAAGADVLTVYDPAGGYGHPDHVQVHRVGVRAAELAGTPVVLEATVDRRNLLRVLRVLAALHLTPPDWRPQRFAAAYAEPGRITHRVDVGRYASAKRSAMAAHASQATADEGVRTLAVFLRLPGPLFRLVFGHEWFVERGRSRPPRPVDDIFESLEKGDGKGGRTAGRG